MMVGFSVSISDKNVPKIARIEQKLRSARLRLETIGFHRYDG